MMAITDQLSALRQQAAELHECFHAANIHVTKQRSIECLQELQKAQTMIMTMGEAIISAKLNVPVHVCKAHGRSFLAPCRFDVSFVFLSS